MEKIKKVAMKRIKGTWNVGLKSTPGFNFKRCGLDGLY